MGKCVSKNKRKPENTTIQGSSNNQSQALPPPPTRQDKEMKIKREGFVQNTQASFHEVYEPIKDIGEGNYGKVQLCRHRQTHQFRAVKQINISAVRDQLNEMLGEIDILKKLDHPNIIKIYEIIRDEGQIYIVMEYCSGGDFFDKIDSQREFTEHQAAVYIRQILSAINYCHQNGVVHRDLKPENFILENDKPDSILKIIDFGTCVKFEKDVPLDKFIGTAYYLAPEVIRKKYTEKCDIWSIGVILYIILCGAPPFNGISDHEIQQKILQTRATFSEPEWRSVSKDAKAFVQKLLNKDYKQRPTAEEALKNKWIVQLGSQKNGKSNMLNSLKQLQRFNTEYKLCQAVLSFISSHVLSNQEITEMRDAFFQLDSDGNGSLSREELVRGSSRLKITIEEIDRILEQCDVDGDGSVNYSEFITAATNWKQTLNRQNLQTAFEMFDKDGNGTISLDELKQALGGDDFASNDIYVRMMEEADTNNDGEIDLDEFIAYMLRTSGIES